MLTALALAWLAAVVLVEATGAVTAADVASSPDAVTAGRLWTLLSSSLVTDATFAFGQIGIVALLTALVLWRDGAVVWWIAALAGHIGSALIAYASIGIAVALGSDSAERFTDAPDYGISCVLAALNGALLATAVARIRAHRADALDIAVLPVTALVAVFWFATLDWYGAEHVYATVLGALAAHWRKRIR